MHKKSPPPRTVPAAADSSAEGGLPPEAGQTALATSAPALLTPSDSVTETHPARGTLRFLVPRSLTSRLTAGAVALALVLSISGATYLALQAFLFNRLDQQLTEIADVAHAGFYFSPTFNYRGSAPTAAGHVWAVAFDGSGHTVNPNPALASPMLLGPGDQQKLSNAASPGPRFVTMTNRRRLRVQAVRAGSILSDTGVSQAVVVVGLPTADVSNTLHRLLYLEFVIGASAAMAALAATSFGVRASLRRLRRITRPPARSLRSCHPMAAA
jgi:two-component system OmpR family sensor kinase